MDRQAKGRRRLLLGSAAFGAMGLLAGCGEARLDLTVGRTWYRHDRVVVNEDDDGTEVRLWPGQLLEVRLAVNPADGYVTFLRRENLYLLRLESGAERFDTDPARPGLGVPFERWVFEARQSGWVTLQLEYRQNAYSEPVRVVRYNVWVR